MTSSSSSSSSSESNSQSTTSRQSYASKSSHLSLPLAEQPSISDDPEENTVAVDLVVTKYKMTGDIVNHVLKQVIASCVGGASVLDLCVRGDYLLKEETEKVFKKAKEIKKGIAFPTCISVNNCEGNFTPSSPAQDFRLKNEDVVKVELGAHIDGYIATVSHTIVVGASPSTKVKGKRADAIIAAHFASEAAFRLLKPGNDKAHIVDTVQSMANAYNCKAVRRVLSHKLRRFNIHDMNVICQNPDEQQKLDIEPTDIRVHSVYAMNVVISSGEGVGRPELSLSNVYMKAPEIYKLRQKSSRLFYSEVEKNYGTLPFNIRDFNANVKAKLGLVECVKHNVIQPFLVAYEKANDFVASFMFTVLLMPNGPLKITGIPFEHELYESEHTYLNTPALKMLLSQTGNPRKAQKKKARKLKRTHPEWSS